MTLSDQTKWLVVSTYSNGDRVLEAVWHSRDKAEADVQRVQKFRDDQDEAPVVTVEAGRDA